MNIFTQLGKTTKSLQQYLQEQEIPNSSLLLFLNKSDVKPFYGVFHSLNTPSSNYVALTVTDASSNGTSGQKTRMLLTEGFYYTLRHVGPENKESLQIPQPVFIPPGTEHAIHASELYIGRDQVVEYIGRQAFSDGLML